VPADQLDAIRDALGDRYRVEREIGHGGMATVYLAQDLKHDRPVAIKVLRPELTAALGRERFLREIRIAAKLNHPHILTLHDSGDAGGFLYYVMPYVEGESLQERLAREKQLPVEEALRIVREVAAALTYAHARDVLHRDIKPANILLSGGFALVADFGLARAITRAKSSTVITKSGLAVGSPAYMSPEQGAGETELDGRSDVYSLGCVLYELLAGDPPFSASNPAALLARHAAAPVPPIRVLRPSVPPGVARALERALEKAPADRFRSAEELAEALADPLGPSPTSAVAPLPARSRARRLAALVAGGAAVATALVFALSRLPGPERDRDAGLDGPVPRRLAVLYFDDHSPDRSLGYLASGLTESLIQELGSVAAIQVVSRNGVKPFRAAPVRMDSLVGALRVGTVVEGSVQRSNDRIRVMVQMIDAATNTHLESASVERDTDEVFLLGNDLAHEVAKLLQRRIGRVIRVRETTAATRSARALELVFRADQARDDAEAAAAGHDTLSAARSIALLRTADSLLEGAERADRRWLGPVLARGWVALDAALRQSGVARDRASQRAVEHAERALSGEPGNAAALELRGTTLYHRAARLPVGDAGFDRLLGSAQADLERAVALDSTLATAWGTLGRVRVARGEVAAAEEDARAAFAMDAYLKDAPDILVSLYSGFLISDSLAGSWRWCERGARDYPSDPRFIECRLTLLAEDPSRPPDPRLAWSLVEEGNRLDPPAQALAAGRPYRPAYREMMAAAVEARGGQRDRARAAAARARALLAGDPELLLDFTYEDAYLRLLLGRKDEAVGLLSRYLAARPSLTGLVSRHPRWRALRSDSAFVRLLRRPSTR
jgi:serine/threonine-protein kinase